jgi:nucleoid-associated protein YgaU
VPSSYQGPIRRINRGRGHSYVDANGAKVPGVTTILNGGVPKPALINWAANTTIAYAVDHWDELGGLSVSARIKRLEKARFSDRDAAANRGTQVHKLAEKLIAGTEVDVPEELAGHVESYVKFLDDWGVQPVLTEAVVMSHSYGWAGTLDVIGDFPTLGERLLYDVKTSRSGVWGETAWQLAGYRYADTYLDSAGEEQEMLPVDGCAVVHVRADGYSFIPMTVGTRQLRELRYINEVARACEVSRDYVGQELLPPGLAVAQ